MIVRDFHDGPAAEQAADDFERRARGGVPDDAPERPMLRGTVIEHLLLECGLAKSGSEATRKVQQGAVRINGEKFTSVRTPVDRLDSFQLQVGRQIMRIVVLSADDVLVKTIPGQSGDAWIIMQNKGQVDVTHTSEGSALARAHEVAGAVHSRVFVFQNERLREDAQHE